MSEKAKVGDVVVFLNEILPDGSKDTAEHTVIACPPDLLDSADADDTFFVDKDGEELVFCAFPEEYRIVRRHNQ
jgi:hypothetical protein